MNMKGGVGKTTLAVEVSWTLARNHAKNVLLIDYDPQANASFAFLEASRYFRSIDAGRSIANCLMPSVRETDPFEVIGSVAPAQIDVNAYSVRVRKWRYRNPSRTAGLYLVPGALTMMRLALNPLSPDDEVKLRARWDGLISSAQDAFDCVVVDCHPAGSFFTKTALLASDAVVVPVTSDAFAATGLSMMRQHMEMWESSGGAREFLVVFNDANRAWETSVESQIRRDARFADHCLSTRVRYSTLLRNLPKRHQTAAEQPVAYRKKVGNNIALVSQEVVELLKDKSSHLRFPKRHQTAAEQPVAYRKKVGNNIIVVNPMRSWEIARLLLNRCSSSQDVDQVLETLSDPLALEELRAMLRSFASNHGVDTPSTMPKREPLFTPELGQQAVDDRVKALPDTSKSALAEQLEVLFRAGEMTNKQVEQWFATNFQIVVPIGKGALRKYLLKVLTGADLGLGNRILATAQGRLTTDSAKKSEIKDYWDQLDKHFSKVK